MPGTTPAVKHSETHQHTYNIWSRVLGAAIAGMTECVTIHPFDTIAKQAQRNKQPIPLSVAGYYQLKDLLFKNEVNPSYSKCISTLYKGVGTALGYKLTQRTITFTTQAASKPYINTHFGNDIEYYLGKKHRPVMIEATAGALSGFFELVVLPLDLVKLKRQTGILPPSYSTKTYFKEHKVRQLYHGSTITLLRNMPASFFLFGGSAFAKDYIFKLENYHSATFGQEIVASGIGAFAAVAVSNPADAIKTRVQLSDGMQNARSIAKEMYTREGLYAFSKGLEARLSAAVPRLIVAMTVAKQIPKVIDPYIQQLGMFANKPKQPSKKMERAPEHFLPKKP